MTGITLVADREPWARQPHETEKQYVAFQVFLGMEPPRSVVRLAQESDKGSVSHLYQWSSRNRWTERSQHYDGFLRRSFDAELIAERKEMNKRHAQLAKAMSSKVAARLGKLEAEELSPGELGRWMQVISMVERLALGEATTIEGSDGSSKGVNVEVSIDNREQVVAFDRGYVSEVLDRLAGLGIVPSPIGDGSPVGIIDAEATVEVRSDQP